MAARRAQTILGELDRAGVRYRLINGARHRLVEWFDKSGKRHKRPCDIRAKGRAFENARHEIRRELREAGEITGRS